MRSPTSRPATWSTPAGRRPSEVHRLPSPDGDVRQWYRATAAWLQERNDYAEFQPHLTRARYLFPDDPVFVMYLGTMHTAFAEPRIQNALPEPSQIMRRTSRDLTSTAPPPPIGAADVELDRAEGWFRKALAQDRNFTEARIRLGYVLGRLGRHADAATELQRALTQDPPGLLRYYAQLLLGRAQLSRRRPDLAIAASRVLDLISTQEPTRAGQWTSRTVTLVDLPPSHPAFKDVSRAIVAGVLDAPNRTFDPTRLVTGSEAQDAVLRLERLVGTSGRGTQR